jgi:type IV secretory pathway TrbF-like protein
MTKRIIPWLKPDNKPKQVKPTISVASYVVDQWRWMAVGGVVIGVIGTGFGLAAGAYAFAKERMPSYTITPIIQPNGWMVETYVDGGNEPLNERIVCSVIKSTFYMLRTVAGSKAGVKSNLDIATANFADAAAIRARRELEAQDWYAPLLQHRISREVSPEMNCHREVHASNSYVLEWTERLHSQTGPVANGEFHRTISIKAEKMDKTPDSRVNWNPWGVFITDYSGILD